MLNMGAARAGSCTPELRLRELWSNGLQGALRTLQVHHAIQHEKKYVSGITNEVKDDQRDRGKHGRDDNNDGAGDAKEARLACPQLEHRVSRKLADGLCRPSWQEDAVPEAGTIVAISARTIPAQQSTPSKSIMQVWVLTVSTLTRENQAELVGRLPDHRPLACQVCPEESKHLVQAFACYRAFRAGQAPQGWWQRRQSG